MKHLFLKWFKRPIKPLYASRIEVYLGVIYSKDPNDRRVKYKLYPSSRGEGLGMDFVRLNLSQEFPTRWSKYDIY